MTTNFHSGPLAKISLALQASLTPTRIRKKKGSAIYQQVAGFVASDQAALQFSSVTIYLHHSSLDPWTFLVVSVTGGLLLLRLEPQVALL